MKIKCASKVLLLVSCVFLGWDVQAKTDITSIRVSSSWTGLGPSSKSNLLIKRSGDHFQAGGRKIDKSVIDELTEALATPLPLTISNLGLTDSWLEDNAEPALQEYFDKEYPGLSEAQHKLFRRSFQDKDFLTTVLLAYFGSRGLDDYPHLEMHLFLADGRSISVFSESPKAFMLPWHIEADGRVFVSYNATISKTIAQLLPGRFTNRELLDARFFRTTLARQVMSALHDEWGVLETARTMGPQFELVKQKFTVVNSNVNSISSIDVDTGMGTGVKNWYRSWNALLRREDLPPNWFIGVSLPFKNGEVTGFQDFMEHLDRYINLTRSVPWFESYLKTHQGIRVELRFVKDRSLSAKALSHFIKELSSHERLALADLIAREAAGVTFLEIGENGCWSRWLVLPDKRMVLWHSKCAESLKWDLKQFKTWECFGQTCAGLVIDENGVVQPVEEK